MVLVLGLGLDVGGAGWFVANDLALSYAGCVCVFVGPDGTEGVEGSDGGATEGTAGEGSVGW